MQTLHIFDAVSRDWRVSQTSDNEMEVEYMTAEDSDGSGGGWKRRKKASSTLRVDTEMVIHLFGMNAAGESVRVDVSGFRPFLYVALPNSEPNTDALERRIRAKLRIKEDTFEYKIENKRKLYGYSGSKTYRFVKITVPSLNMFYNLRKELLGDKQEPIFRIREREKPLEVFESNIDPMLRFFHLRDLKPCGWISVNGEEIDSEDGIRIQCDWQAISPSEAPPGVVTAPLVHAFWDVECYSHSGDFPIAAPTPRNKSGDPIIQVGTTLWTPAGQTERHIFVLDGCTDVPGAIVHPYKREGEMLLAWFNLMVEKKVNVFVGYNIFGFDERYVWNRLQYLNMTEFDEIQKLSHLFEEGKPMKLIEKRLASSALGDNMLYMWDTPGRLRIDLLGHIKRKAQLPSYKLDSVAAVYLSGKMSGVSALSEGEGKWLIKTKKAEAKDARVGRYIQLLDELGEDLTDKMEILEITADGFVVVSEEPLGAVAGEAVQWAVVKDDVSPAEIFKLHRGSDADRAKVAAYCVQDCDLTLELYKKLDVFNEAMSMANVCSVPVSYIFTRGQGIKIESLIFKDCMLKGQLIKVLEVPLRNPNAPSAQVAEKYKDVEGPALADAAKALEKSYRDADKKELEYVKKLWAFKEELGAAKEDSYEGAIVLDPTPGFYTDSPVGVCDFASLYPSTIISENISHDMLVWAKDYDLQGNLVSISYGSVADEQNVTTGTRWTDIEFDILRPDPADKRKQPVKLKVGVRHCRYAQPPNDEKGSLPQIVAKLLAARKAKRAEIPKTDDPFKKALLDAEQNAYKITANSLYGQLGSPTFKIRLQNLAASVTAYGRKQIMFSKGAIEKFYGPAAGDPRCDAEIVYGDTDSIFVSFSPRNPETGERLEGREAIVATQHLTEEVGKFITATLKTPHDFEYDKTFSPFIIFSKKRYVGNKYEESPDDFKETSMGIVLKRRDNAPLLKMTYGAAIDRLLNHRDVAGAVDVVRQKVRELVEGKMKLSQLTITKSLRSEYKCTPPAHKMLANRIAARDPGNAPASGERIGYVYVQTLPGQVVANQGDRVETPEFIVANKLKPDAEYYIEHQLYNPLAQLFGLMVEKMPGFRAPAKWAENADKLVAQREAIAADLLFGDALAKFRGHVISRSPAEFVGKMFTGGTAQAQQPLQAQQSLLQQQQPLRNNRKAPVDATMAAAEAAAFGAGASPGPKKPMFKQQSIMSAFAISTAVFTDERLANAMRAAKAAKAKAKAKPKKKDEGVVEVEA
jgi:DNA polymerase elongation subunit (family B)